MRLLFLCAITLLGCDDTAVVLSIAPGSSTVIDSFCVDVASDGESRFHGRYSVAELAKEGKGAPWTLTVFPGARTSARARASGLVDGQEVAGAGVGVQFQSRKIGHADLVLDRCAGAGTLGFVAGGAAMAGAGARGVLMPGPAGAVAALFDGGALRTLQGADLKAIASQMIGGTAGGVAAGDLDGDCDVDVVAIVDGVPVAWIGDSTGGMAPDRQMLPALAGMAGVAIGDVDGDLLPDVVACGGAGAHVLRNGGQGRFVEGMDAFAGGDAIVDATACLLADLQGKGRLDLVVGQGSAMGAVDRVYFNDGFGHFSYVAAALPPLPERTTALAAGDVDGNGTIDLVAAHAGGPVRLYRNGTGVKQGVLSDFSIGLPDQAVGEVRTLLLADLDGDCAPELVVMRVGEAPRVWRNRNDGGGRFEEVVAPGLGMNDAQAAAALDVDGDGVLDLLLSGGGQAVAIYRQKGVGR